MRIVALIMSILGALAALGVGLLFVLGNSMAKDSPQFRLAMELIRSPEIPETGRAKAKAALGRQLAIPYFLLAAVPLAIIGGMLAMERRRLWAALLLLMAAVGPIVLSAGYAMAVQEDRMPRRGDDISPVVLLFVLTGIPAGFLTLGALFAALCKRLPESSEPIPSESRHHDAD